VRVAGRSATEAQLAQALDAVGLAGFEDSMARSCRRGNARVHWPGCTSARRAAVDPDEPFTALERRRGVAISAL